MDKRYSICESCNILDYKSQMWEIDGFYYCDNCYYEDFEEE